MVDRCQAAALTIDPVISHLASVAYACTGSVVWSCLSPRGYEPGPPNRPDHANLVKFSIFLTCIQSNPIVPLHHWVHMGQHISRQSGGRDQRLGRRRVEGDGWLHDAEEQRAAVARAAPVEPEGELVEVAGQMCVRDRAMMRPK